MSEMSEYKIIRIDPSREIASRAWHRRPGQRLVRVSPILEPTPVSPVIRSSSSDSASDSDLVEMADNTANEIGSEEEEEKRPEEKEIEKSITVKLIKSPEPSFEQLVEGTQFMVGMVQTGSGIEWSQKIPEFEDFLGIGDEASRMVQEQKAKARILQSVLAAED
ncbi:hypothetical protein JCGZ_05098 [Jatropha curcas]|uniref:Uncharacterized protein n=1 Tax=Jatropha curcas TaxID=180498 RepID=A0A067LF17_JATCU|nr:hypothetical protein JCGZ_05098 [Jatropha curcas]